MGQSPDSKYYLNMPSNYILVQGNADLKDGWVFPRVWTTEKIKIAAAGSLVMSVRAPAGAMGKTAYDIVLGRGVAALDGNEFIFQLLTYKYETDYWKSIASGSTFESINFSDISSASFAFPQCQEQEKIGKILNRIDRIITLHHRQSSSFPLTDESTIVERFIIQ